MSKFHWRIEESEEGSKLVTFLAGKLGFSARFVKKAIDSYHVKVNGRCERFASIRLKEGDRVSFNPPKETASSLQILYEDSYCVLYNKPPGVVCDSKALSVGFKPVHRLDKNTSGVWMVAKSHYSLFENLFRNRSIKKKYLAIVDGVPDAAEGRIEGYIGRLSLEGVVRFGMVSAEEGRLSATEWKRLKSGRSMSLISCRLITGRTHQIRVHLSSIGLPIMGDWQYHDHFCCGFDGNRPLLHAHTLDFVHPITGKEVHVEAPMPEDMVEAYAKIQEGNL